MGPKGKTKAGHNRLQNLQQAGSLTKMVKIQSDKVGALKLELKLLDEECVQLENEKKTKLERNVLLKSSLGELKYQCDQLEQRLSEYTNIIQMRNAEIVLKNRNKKKIFEDLGKFSVIQKEKKVFPPTHNLRTYFLI